jgi:hypothetical protein
MADIQRYISEKISGSGLRSQIAGAQKNIAEIQIGGDFTSPISAKPASYRDDSKQKVSDVSDSNGQIVIPVYLDGKKIAEATAPYNDIIQGKNLVFAGRGIGIG